MDRAAARLRAGGIDPESASWSPTPAFDGPQVSVPAEARERFRTQVEALLDEAADESAPGAVADDGASVQHGVFQAACAACGGRCCRLGATHTAFLTADTLRRVARSRPGETGRAQLLSLYLAHVGPTHAEGSCVFHGDAGCRLPRSLRSDTCNRWMCGDLRRLLDAGGTFDGVPDGHRFVAVTHDGRRTGGVERYSSRAKAASKADAEGGKSSRRT